jgi:hypothetical protein
MNAEIAFFSKFLKKDFGKRWVHEFAVTILKSPIDYISDYMLKSN